MPAERKTTTDLPTIGVATLREGAAFLKSAHWLARVVDPRRPPLPQVTAWADAQRAARRESDPRTAARLARPKSLLAQRLARHFSVLLDPPTDADILAGSAQIVPGASLLLLTLALVSRTGIEVPDHPVTLLLGVWDSLEPSHGGLSRAYGAYRAVLDAQVTEVDPADTEAKIREERMSLLRGRPPRR